MAEHGDWMFFGGGYMWIVWLAFIFITIYLVKSIINTDSSPDKHPDDILKKRLANGEISEDEYKRLKQEIDS